MIFAARKLQGIGMIMLVTFFLLIAYPISLQVSATRAELQKVERQIAATRQRNRMIEGDIAVLANAHQLDRWNNEFFGYVPPTAAQYLPGERALANLDSLRPPSNPAPRAPVLMAMNDTPARPAAVAATEASEPERSTREDRAPAAAARGIVRVSAPQQVAMLDRAQLASTTLRDIARSVAASAPEATQ